MHIGDFDFYQEFLLKRMGLSLTPDKSYLLDSRLTPVSKKWNFPNLEMMTMSLRGMPDPRMVQDVIEAMTAHDTSFFMDNRSFVFFEKTALPAIMKNRRTKHLRLWCAACSSGQEPYSLALALRELGLHVQGWRIEILATDVSKIILAAAEQGIYQQLEVQRGLSSKLLVKYFDQRRDGQWEIKSEIRRMVTFRHFNLLDNLMALGQFDAIFCRNVLNTFDDKTANRVIAALAPQLTPDGYLFLGEDEAVQDPGPLAPITDTPGVFALKDKALGKAASG